MMMADQIAPVSLSLPPVDPGVPWYLSTTLWLTVLWVLIPAFLALVFLRFVPLFGKAAAFGLIRWRVLPGEFFALRRVSVATGLPLAVLLISRSAFDRGAVEAARAGRRLNAKALARVRGRVFG